MIGVMREGPMDDFTMIELECLWQARVIKRWLELEPMTGPIPDYSIRSLTERLYRYA